MSSDEEKIERIQKDQMVQLLKRNHDVLLEKYELFRSRNESLEKLAVEKESLYNDMKINADKLSAQLFSLQKSAEESQNQREILQTKVNKLQEDQKSYLEQIKTLKQQKDKYEAQSKVLNEQLELVQNSHDGLSSKKATETDLLSKEINQLTLKERDARQKLQWSENEINEVKD